MAADDSEEFIAAMVKEIKDLFDTEVWELILISDLPADAILIPLIWSFRRKRDPMGNLLKHKARICVHGGKQCFGLDYWTTYAPVANWGTIRMVLLLVLMHNWVTRQIDYVLAFSQAPIDSNVFCKLPTGFQGQDKNRRYCLRLKKNLYGTKQAAANWFEMLRDNLIDLGFTQSAIDPCLFLRCDCILISYVDDCLVFSKDQKTIDELLIKLGQRFVLTNEGPDVSS